MLVLAATQLGLAVVVFAKDVTPPYFKFAHVKDVGSRMQIKILIWKHFKTVLLIASRAIAYGSRISQPEFFKKFFRILNVMEVTGYS